MTKEKRVHKTPVIISERDDAIIHAVYTYRYLTSEQITRLFFSKGSGSHVRVIIKSLSDAEYLYRFHLPVRTKGEIPYVYTLGSKGMKYLKRLETDGITRFRSTVSEVSYQHITHTLALNDMLIAASLLCTSEPGISLNDLRHEWYLKHTPLTVKVTNTSSSGKKAEIITVVPDAFLDFRFRVNGKYRGSPIWLELDRGTEGVKQFKRKIRGLLTAVLSPQYEELFNTKAVTIAFATTAEGNRLTHMREWVKQELTELDKLAESSLFLFTKLPHGELDPRTLYLAPTWYLPDDTTPLPLLDLT